MARIKKRGLDYFPMNTDFLQSRSVRRLLKREGDAALAALLGALSIIYDDEGYFVRLDDDLCEDLSDGLFSLEAADVRRVLQTAVEVGLFDEGMFREHGILTSEEIQRQFLFIKRPRKRALIDERYCLLPPDEEEENAAAPADGEGTKVQDLGTKSTQIVQKTPENVDFTPQSTQSKEKESIEKQSKADLLPNGSPQTGGTPAAGRMPAEEEGDVGGEKAGRRSVRVDARRHRPPRAPARRLAAQPRRPAADDGPVPHHAPRAVCHHLPEQLRAHRPSRLAGLRTAPCRPWAYPRARAVPAQPVPSEEGGCGQRVMRAFLPVIQRVLFCHPECFSLSS